MIASIQRYIWLRMASCGQAHGMGSSSNLLLASAESLQRSLRHKNCRETAPLGLLARLLTQSPVLLRARLPGPEADVTALGTWGCPGRTPPSTPSSRKGGGEGTRCIRALCILGFKGRSLGGGRMQNFSQVQGTQDTFGHHLEAGICTSSLFWKATMQDTY